MILQIAVSGIGFLYSGTGISMGKASQKLKKVDFLRYKFKSRFNPNPNRLPAISGYQNFN